MEELDKYDIESESAAVADYVHRLGRHVLRSEYQHAAFVTDCGHGARERTRLHQQTMPSTLWRRWAGQTG